MLLAIYLGVCFVISIHVLNLGKKVPGEKGA
jgi:hypothetical protein